jgi:hypothetical protein
VSPILIRPIREQIEHDRIIRVLHARLRGEFDVESNLGDDRRAALRVGQRVHYPDIVFTAPGAPRKVAGVVEVETAESVNHLEAMAQWAHFGKARAPFYLYVPVSAVDIARRLVGDYHAAVTELWSYAPVGDRVHFRLVQASGASTTPPGTEFSVPVDGGHLAPRPEEPSEAVVEAEPAPAEPPTPATKPGKPAKAPAAPAAPEPRVAKPAPVPQPKAPATPAAKVPGKPVAPTPAAKKAVAPRPPAEAAMPAKASKPARPAKPVKTSKPTKPVKKAAAPARSSKATKPAPRAVARPAKPVRKAAAKKTTVRPKAKVVAKAKAPAPKRKVAAKRPAPPARKHR